VLDGKSHILNPVLSEKETEPVKKSLIQKINEKNKFRINMVKTIKTDGNLVPTNKAVRGDV
jgi:hypothetical protein